MKRVFTAVLLLTFSLAAFAQQAPPAGAPPAGGPREGGPPAAQAPAAETKNFEGSLAKVDVAAKLITVKGADNKEMMFAYDDKTQIVGVEGPQGLSGKTGSNLKIAYRENRGINLASRVEVAAAQPAR
jgi:hypothetical protein